MKNIIMKLVGISSKTSRRIKDEVEERYQELIASNPSIQTDELVKQLKILKSELMSNPSFMGAGLAESIIDPEAYRRLSYEDLPPDVQLQLRRDGTRGELRTHQEAKDVYENDIPAEAKGSEEGVRSITNDPEIDWKHQEAHSKGGSNTHENGNYGHSSTNTGTDTPTEQEIQQDWKEMEVVAEANTPGVSGDLGEVIGESIGCGVGGGVLGAGMGLVSRLVQAQGYRDAGRSDLAAQAESRIGEDVVKGGINGVKYGTSMAVTQTILGSNPVTAGLGLVVPDAIDLKMNRHKMSQQEKEGKIVGMAGKGTLGIALSLAGPVGWAGLVGIGLYSAYNSAQQQSNKAS